MVQPTQKICSRCILSAADDQDITFDETGLCSYCREFDREKQSTMFGRAPEEKIQLLSAVLERIKQAGKGREYDCVLGVSGGVDSTYLAYLAKTFGLRPLVVHYDNGWDSEMAVKNIQNMCSRLGFNLYTYVNDWEEFRDIQRAFFYASVVDIEMITDHAIGATLYRMAAKKGIKYIISGYNASTESILPASWIWHKDDFANIKDIHKKFGSRKMKSFPRLSFLNRLWYVKGLGIQRLALLDYVEYNKEEAKRTITGELGWVDYGQKHHESVFTRFYQSHILPHKFGIDKRKAHLSSLMCAGQMTRQQAWAELQQPVYNKELEQTDKEYVLKKLGFSEEEFSRIMKMPPRPHHHFKSYKKREEIFLSVLLKLLRPVYKPLMKLFR